MKLISFLSVLVGINISSANLLPVRSYVNETVANFIRSLIMELNSQSQNTHDVAIYRLNKYEKSKQNVQDLTENILQVIPKSSLVLIPPMDQLIEDRNLRVTSINIIVSDAIDPQSLVYAMEFVEVSEYYNNMMKFILVAVNAKESVLSRVSKFLFEYKIINVVVIGTFDGLFKAFSYNPFRKPSVYLLPDNSTSIARVFPEKMNQMNGYTYRILFWISLPNTVLANGNLESLELNFMEAVIQKQNARIKLVYLNRNPSSKAFLRYMETVDVCINTAVSYIPTRSRYSRTVNTFDTDGYCTLVPTPIKNLTFEFIIKPFDLWTWIGIGLTMVCSAIVWQFLKRNSIEVTTNTSGYFIFGFVSNFFGQMIPFREQLPIQKILLQLTIVLNFILGTAYQSIVISLISGSRYAHKISTIDELFKENISFYVANTFENDLRGSEYALALESRTIGTISEVKEKYETLSLKNIALIHSCSSLNFWIDFMKNGGSTMNQIHNHYYILNQRFNTFYLNIQLSETTFFLEKLSELSLMIFESGIRQHWGRKNPKEDIHAFKLRNYNQNEEYFLKLTILAPIFYLLAIGLFSSFMIFLLEIFWHDFIQFIDWKKLTDRIELLRRRFNRQRVLKVRPVNEVEEQV